MPPPGEFFHSFWGEGGPMLVTIPFQIQPVKVSLQFANLNSKRLQFLTA